MLKITGRTFTFKEFPTSESNKHETLNFLDFPSGFNSRKRLASPGWNVVHSFCASIVKLQRCS